MPAVTGVLETALYVEDVGRSVQFYRTLLQAELLEQDQRFAAINIADRQVLLLFRKRGSRTNRVTPAGSIPEHDAEGRIHFALGIPLSEWDAWKRHLEQLGVPIESEVHWPLGGQSLYFRDPDGHLGELATPGTWRIY